MSNSKHPIEEECNYYCNDKIHAVTVLAKSHATKESVLESVEAYYSAYYWKIIDAKKAEVDKEELYKKIKDSTSGAKLIMPFDSKEYDLPDDNISSYEPWLLFLEDLK